MLQTRIGAYPEEDLSAPEMDEYTWFGPNIPLPGLWSPMFQYSTFWLLLLSSTESYLLYDALLLEYDFFKLVLHDAFGLL